MKNYRRNYKKMSLNDMKHELVRLVHLLLSDHEHQSNTHTVLEIKRLMVEMVEIYRGNEDETRGGAKLNFE